jgi:hypothetical protein
MSWAGNVVLMEQKGNSYIDIVRKPEGKDLYDNLNVDWKINLVLEKQNWLIWIYSCGSGRRPVTGSCERDREPSGFKES